MTTWIETLRNQLGDNVSTKSEELSAHGRAGNSQRAFLPECVVYVRNKKDVLSTLKVAREHNVSITPFGAGSSLEGNTFPVEAGISLDLTRMDKVRTIDPDNLSVTVEPGVLHPELNNQLHPHGLFFPVDPGADATLGGMAGTNASGSNAVRYGAMRNQVLQMEIILPDGRVMQLGSRARKSSSGFDLKNLFIGSEGTLGIITELAVKIYPIPAHTVSVRATFPKIGLAGQVAVQLGRSQLNISRLELVDAECIRAVNKYKSAAYPEHPTLWIELHNDSEDALAEEASATISVCQATGARDVTLASTVGEQSQLWEARHHVWYALRDLYPQHHTISTDICVPIAQLPEAITFTQQLMGEYSLFAPIVGHVGDGNYHVFFHLPYGDVAGWERLERMMGRMVSKALELGGTSTGEHGVGLHKVKYQALEHGEALSLMQELKTLCDPLGLLNPGKVIPNLPQ